MIEYPLMSWLEFSVTTHQVKMFRLEVAYRNNSPGSESYLFKPVKYLISSVCMGFFSSGISYIGCSISALKSENTKLKEEVRNYFIFNKSTWYAVRYGMLYIMKQCLCSIRITFFIKLIICFIRFINMLLYLWDMCLCTHRKEELFS